MHPGRVVTESLFLRVPVLPLKPFRQLAGRGNRAWRGREPSVASNRCATSRSSMANRSHRPSLVNEFRIAHTGPSLRGVLNATRSQQDDRRRVTSSGVAITMSLQTGRSPRARRISIAVSRLSDTLGRITSKSTSLESVAVPRAWDPKRTSREGFQPSTMRSTMVDMNVSRGRYFHAMRPYRRWTISTSPQCCFRYSATSLRWQRCGLSSLQSRQPPETIFFRNGPFDLPLTHQRDESVLVGCPIATHC